MKPNVEGLFVDTPEDAYHADAMHEIPSLSASLAKYLIEATPLHCWWNCARLNPKFKPKESDSFDRGKIAHAWTLGHGADVVEVPFDNWRTKEARDMKE